MTITSSSFANVNVGAVPNDGTGDPLRTSFVKLNENFQYINEKIWPNLLIDPPSLTADVVSSYISQFNLIQASQILVTQNQGTIDANVITANTISAIDFVTSSNITSDNIIANTVTANSINGPIGTTKANTAYFTNVWANGTATVSATGSIPGYTYQWLDASDNAINQNTASASCMSCSVLRIPTLGHNLHRTYNAAVQ